MPLFTLTGDDTVIIAGRVLNDLADNDVSSLRYTSNIADKRTGKNGNTIIAKNESGRNGDMDIRVMRGSSDDIFLNSLMTSQIQNFLAFTLLTGQIVKNLGDGQGNTLQDVYNLTGGFFMKEVDTTINVQGNTEQAVAVYHLGFSSVNRAPQ